MGNNNNNNNDYLFLTRVEIVKGPNRNEKYVKSQK